VNTKCDAESEWLEMMEGILENCHKADEKGNPVAMWDAVLVCKQHNLKEPEWLRLKLIEYASAQGKINRDNGRPTDYCTAIRVYFSVRELRGELDTKETATHSKANKLSLEKCFAAVKNELLRYYGLSLSEHSIQKAYYKGKKYADSGKILVGPVSEEFYKVWQ
jgi:hypothetical protein